MRSISFAVTVQDLKVIVSDECTVTFDPMDGSEAVTVTVLPGEKLTEPQSSRQQGGFL